MLTLTTEIALTDVVAANVRAMTAMLGMNQQDLASTLGVTQSTISGKFNGRTKWSLDELPGLAHALNTDVTSLLTPSPVWINHIKQNRPTGEIHQAGGWRARRDSNPQPSDP